jgi:hypothetical protein
MPTSALPSHLRLSIQASVWVLEAGPIAQSIAPSSSAIAGTTAVATCMPYARNQSSELVRTVELLGQYEDICFGRSVRGVRWQLCAACTMLAGHNALSLTHMPTRREGDLG